MPSNITQYKIFLASPSDLLLERTLIEEVIKELNITFGIRNNIHIELLKWETHSAPAISEDHVQSIINDDISNDYDLFIGLLWKKFGTPTDKANSGTEEEFLNAYNRFKKNSTALQILFYFKNAPISPAEIDIEQLRKVQEFKSEISKKKNVLYGEYLDEDQLCSYLRIHIPKRILELHQNQKIENLPTEDKKEEIIIPEILPIEEFGLIDYQDQFDESIDESNQALGRMTEAMEWVSEQFSKKTEEMNILAANKKQPPARKAVRELLVRTAKIMDNFGKRIETETPIFYENFELAINSMQKTLDIYRSDFDLELEEAIETREALSNLIFQMENSLPNTEDFVESIEKFPNMSKEINTAKMKLKVILDKLLENFRISISIARDLLDSFDDFINFKNKHSKQIT